MIASMKARPLLDAFRGEAAVDRQALLQTLMGLSALAMEVPEVAEIDINPLIATATGRLVAVDALITLASPDGMDVDSPRVEPRDIHRLFYPRSVAFVGASSELGKWGHSLICNTLGGGFQGQVYAVNPKGEMIAGKPSFRTVADIPGPVDLAVVTITGGSGAGPDSATQGQGHRKGGDDYIGIRGNRTRRQSAGTAIG